MVFLLVVSALISFVALLVWWIGDAYRCAVPLSQRLSNADIDVLFSLFDGIFQRCQGGKTAAERRWMSFRPSDYRADLLERGVFHTLDSATEEKHLAQKLGLVIRVLGTRIGCKLLTGSWALLPSRSPKQMEELFVQWESSSDGVRRSLAATFIAIGWRAIVRWRPELVYDPVDYAHVRAVMTGGPQLVLCDTTVGTVSTTAVICGSGVGGGIAAYHLSRNEIDCVVLETGQQIDYTNDQDRWRAFARSALLSSDDANMAVLTAECLGGGSTINWSASFRTPDAVLDEWANEFGLTFCQQARYRKGVEELERLLNIHPPGRHCSQNSLMIEAAKRLGWKHAEVNINTKGCAESEGGHNCNLVRGDIDSNQFS